MRNVHFCRVAFFVGIDREANDLARRFFCVLFLDLNVRRAGDFADPHGTHIVCFRVVAEALKRLKAAGEPWVNDCWLWMYKGAWQEWDISEIEMAVPVSPEQVMKKRYGIFIHQSQKDMVPFQGSDSREFWQRAEERNANTANLYGKLGLTQYAAMEAFVRWKY